MKGWRIEVGNGTLHLVYGRTRVLLMPDGSVSVHHPDKLLYAVNAEGVPSLAQDALPLNGKSRRNLIKRKT